MSTTKANGNDAAATRRRPPTPLEPSLLDRLDRAWAPARQAGAVGSDSIETLRLHAAGYLLDEWRGLQAGRFVDCGTGAGILGVLLALELPDSRWWLVDARERRCDMARRAVLAAGLTARVSVEHARVDDMARGAGREVFDGAVARSFGPVAELAECVPPLLKTGGSLVASVTSSTEQSWRSLTQLARAGCEISEEWVTPHGKYLSVRRFGPVPPEIPRRPAARRREPWGQATPVSRETQEAPRIHGRPGPYGRGRGPSGP